MGDKSRLICESSIRYEIFFDATDSVGESKINWMVNYINYLYKLII